MSSSQKRIDELLVEWGLVRSRSLAQELISKGLVTLQGRIIEKPSLRFDPGTLQRTEIQIQDDPLLRYVSRGGVKLEGALQKLNLDVMGFKVLDIGISTGGFSDCLLQRGASSILGIDVGTNQTHEKLRNDPRVQLYEGINARESEWITQLSQKHDFKFDLIVVDVSFISLRLLVPNLVLLAGESTQILALVKPQFELGASQLNKKGVVKDAGLYKKLQNDLTHTFEESFFKVKDYFESSIEGSDGNIEFFLFAQKSSTKS